MKVSIITISYNQAPYLEKAILSVINQDYSDIEYIVVDPGSTDGSREIIEKYRKNIDKIIFEPDGGPSDGLNKGFKFATGDILGYLNSDDYILPGAISCIVDYFLNHSQIDIVSGNALLVDANDKEFRRTYSDYFLLLGVAYGYSHLIQPSTFFRDHAYKITSGFNINNPITWDAELYVEMKLKGMKFGRINSLLSAFRVHRMSISGSGRMDDIKKESQKKMFIKIMKREPLWFDQYIGQLFRLFRYISNPRDIIDRIVKGSYYGKYKNIENQEIS